MNRRNLLTSVFGLSNLPLMMKGESVGPVGEHGLPGPNPWPREEAYHHYINDCFTYAGMDQGWNLRFRNALSMLGLTLEQHKFPPTGEYPGGQAYEAPFPYGLSHAWPQNTYIVWEEEGFDTRNNP